MVSDFENYAHEVLKAKGIKDENLIHAEVTKALKESYGLIYHAVALDVEGTIKAGSEEDIPERILKLIEKITSSGAYILFVTGSGSITVRKILDQIKNVLGESSASYRKIYAIDGNGCRLFFLDKNARTHYRQIVQRIEEKIGEKNYRMLLSDLDHIAGNFEIQEKYCGIRLVSKGQLADEELNRIVSSWYDEKREHYDRIGIKVVSGCWSGKRTYDVSHTDKDYALSCGVNPPSGQ